ncbi:MAG: DUF1501 domain-containing protein [Pirellulaceae bacterium]
MNHQSLLSRRGLLKLGSLSVATSMVPRAARAAAGTESQAKHCIFIMLQGGPSHIDLWDPKPTASTDVRGPFTTIPTSVPGIQFGEPMSETSKVAHHLAVIRSMTHKFTNHIAGTYVTLTGSTNQPDRDREAHADDFPGPAAVLNLVAAGQRGIPTAVSLPGWLSIPGPSNRMPGQYGGFLGSVYDPFLLEGDPQKPDYRPLALGLPEDVTRQRLVERMTLSKQLDRTAHWIEAELNQQVDRLTESAYTLVSDGRLQRALDLSSESAATKAKYGDSRIGQSLLIARRLVEIGVPYVAYNAFNQEWDTHGNLKARYQQIVPPTDRAFAALIQDLNDRGLLDDTLVVNTGEFGRTPKVNNKNGRDHWPNAYSTVLAGGGIRGGLSWGQTDRQGGEVLEAAVNPCDVLATMWRQLRLDPRTEIRDRLGRPHLISNGRVLRELT